MEVPTSNSNLRPLVRVACLRGPLLLGGKPKQVGQSNASLQQVGFTLSVNNNLAQQAQTQAITALPQPPPPPVTTHSNIDNVLPPTETEHGGISSSIGTISIDRTTMKVPTSNSNLRPLVRVACLRGPLLLGGKPKQVGPLNAPLQPANLPVNTNLQQQAHNPTTTTASPIPPPPPPPPITTVTLPVSNNLLQQAQTQTTTTLPLPPPPPPPIQPITPATLPVDYNLLQQTHTQAITTELSTRSIDSNFIHVQPPIETKPAGLSSSIKIVPTNLNTDITTVNQNETHKPLDNDMNLNLNKQNANESISSQIEQGVKLNPVGGDKAFQKKPIDNLYGALRQQLDKMNTNKHGSDNDSDDHDGDHAFDE